MARILLRNNQTGEERWADHAYPWTEGSEYIWVEGNYSCDCNRNLFFERAAGHSPGLDDVDTRG